MSAAPVTASEEPVVRFVTLDTPAETRKPMVVYCVLAGDAECRIEHTSWVIRLGELSADPNFPFGFILAYVANSKPARLAHNVACANFLRETEAEWLWIWAHDMVANDSSLLVLKYADRGDLICPTVRIWNDIEEMPTTTIGMKSAEQWTYAFANFHPGKEPYECDACGSGGLLIRRSVLEDQRMIVAPGDGALEPPTWFDDEYTPAGRRLHGHDLSFSSRAKRLGYRVLAVPEAEAEHFKTLPLNKVTLYALRFAGIVHDDRDRVRLERVIVAEIEGWLHREMFVPEDRPIDPEQTYIHQGLLDSTGVIQLVDWLQEEFSIEIANDEITEENLGGTRRTAAFVVRKRWAKDDAEREAKKGKL